MSSPVYNVQVHAEDIWPKERTKNTSIVLDAIVDAQVLEIKGSSAVIPGQDLGNVIGNEPTKGWCKVVVLADSVVELYERDTASVAREDAWNCVVSYRLRTDVDVCTVIGQRI